MFVGLVVNDIIKINDNSKNMLLGLCFSESYNDRRQERCPETFPTMRNRHTSCVRVSNDSVEFPSSGTI